MNQKGTLVVSISVVLLFLIGALFARMTSDMQSSDDAESIMNTIESAFRLRGEACIRANHGREEEFKKTLASYWNNERPTGDALATREYYTIPTSDPAQLAPYYATAIAKGVVKDTTLEELLAYRPTPSWRPEHSPLEEQWSLLTACQETYDDPLDQAVAFRLSEASYTEITVNGLVADVLVNLTYSSDYEDSNRAIHTVEGTKLYQYSLELSDEGEWLIVAEHLLEPGGP